jgi:hypothetical protein
MRKAIFITLLFSFVAKGSPLNPESANNEILRQNGNLVSVQLVLGEPVRIFVVGKEEAKLDLSKLKLTVRRITPYPSKEYSLDRTGDFFVITEPIDLKKPIDLEITTKVKEESETLRFNLNNKLH